MIDEFFPGVAAVIDDILVGLEDSVREPVLAHELPDILDGFSSGHLAGSGTMLALPITTTARASASGH